jgi:hypothetical protein
LKHVPQLGHLSGRVEPVAQPTTPRMVIEGMVRVRGVLPMGLVALGCPTRHGYRSEPMREGGRCQGVGLEEHEGFLDFGACGANGRGFAL